MVRPAQVVSVMIGSPGDVSDIRKFVENEIYAWNRENLETTNVMLQPVMWEQDSTPRRGARGQEVINEDLTANSDILVAVFWSRLGSSTGKEASGTVEEMKEFARDGKEVLIYFNTAPLPQRHDPEQWKLLQEFKNELRAPGGELAGLTHDFESQEELGRDLQRHLTQTVRRRGWGAAARISDSEHFGLMSQAERIQAELKESIRVKVNPAIRGNLGGETTVALMATVANHGDRPIRLEKGAAFSLPGNKTFELPFGFNPALHGCSQDFPLDLVYGKSCACWISMKQVAEALRKENYVGTVEIVGFFRDALDNRYEGASFAFDIDHWLKE